MATATAEVAAVADDEELAGYGRLVGKRLCDEEDGIAAEIVAIHTAPSRGQEHEKIRATCVKLDSDRNRPTSHASLVPCIFPFMFPFAHPPSGPEAAQRDAEAQAQREAEEQAQREAGEQAQRDAKEQAQRGAAQREADAQAQRKAEAQAQRSAAAGRRTRSG